MKFQPKAKESVVVAPGSTMALLDILGANLVIYTSSFKPAFLSVNGTETPVFLSVPSLPHREGWWD